jgi:rhodanese-related sulfurtransferase
MLDPICHKSATVVGTAQPSQSDHCRSPKSPSGESSSPTPPPLDVSDAFEHDFEGCPSDRPGSHSRRGVADGASEQIAIAGCSFRSPSHHAHAATALAPVLDGVLYLGSYRDTCDADACATLDIRAFLCVAAEVVTPVPPHARGTDAAAVLHLPMRDAADERLARHVPAACAFIDAQAAAGRPVALYCQAGRSRSVSIAAAYLVDRGLSQNGAAAVESIAAWYPRAEPNFAFLQQLADMRPPTPPTPE